MRRIFSKKRLIVSCLLLLAAILAGVVAISTSGGTVQAQDSKSVMLHRDYDTWSYTISKNSDNSSSLHVSYDYNSVQSLKNFRDSNKDLAKKLKSKSLTNFEGIVTFNRGLSLDEFVQMASKYKLTVNSYTIRLTTPSGHRWTIGGVPEGSVLIPHNKLDMEKKAILAKSPDAQFTGIVDAKVSFDASQFDPLSSTKEVFLVDITTTEAKRDASVTMPNLNIASVSIDVLQPYWFMENLGMSNFR